MRDELIEATYSGVRTVRDSNGEEISYRSQGELAAALRGINREIQLREGAAGPRIAYPLTSKGL